MGVEGVQGIERRLVVAAQVLGDPWRPLPARTGEQGLATAQHKGVGGAQAAGQRHALGVRERTHKDGGSPARQRTTFSCTYSELALAVVDQVGAAGASSGSERATWARSAASSGGGPAPDQRVHYRCRCAHGHSHARTRRTVALQTTRPPDAGRGSGPDFPPSRRLLGGRRVGGGSGGGGSGGGGSGGGGSGGRDGERPH